MQEDAAAIAARPKLAESDQVIDPVLAAAQTLGGVRDVEPRRCGRSARRDERSGLSSYLRQLLIGQPESAARSSPGPPSMTRGYRDARLHPLYIWPFWAAHGHHLM